MLQSAAVSPKATSFPCDSARTTDGAARLAASMKLTIVFLMMLFSFDAVRGV
jgi:hypothetical protein